MANQFTTFFNLIKPQPQGDTNQWGIHSNSDWDTVDQQLNLAQYGLFPGVSTPAASGSNILLTNPMSTLTQFSFTGAGLKLELPAMNVPTVASGSPRAGATMSFQNTGSYAAGLYAQDASTQIATIGAGQVVTIQLTSNATANGSFNVTYQQNGIPWAVGAGTGDAITATYTPPNSALSDGLILGVRVNGANATTTPTFAPDGLTAHTLTQSGGAALVAGNIAGALAEYLFRYNLANTRWEVLNPTYVAATVTNIANSQLATMADQTIKGNVSGAPAVPSDLTAAQVTTMLGIASPFAIQGAFKNLALSANGTAATVAISADEIALENASNAYFIARTVSLTLNLAGSGANGLDTGTSATSKWYSVWVIYNGSTVASLASLSATAPTMPSGYTHKARIGWVYTDSSSKYPLKFMQFGRRVQYSPAAGSNITGLPQMATGVQGTYSTTAPTWATIATGNFVPSTASEIIVYLNNNTNNASQGRCALAPNNGYTGWGTATNPAFGAGTGANIANPFNMLLESPNIYYASDSSNQLLSCIGWIDNI